MLTYQRTTALLGLIGALIAPTVARGAPAPRRNTPRMSGPRDKPVVGDSRFPGGQPRPNGALMAPLPAPLRLGAERIAIRCRFGGGGCAVRHEYVVVNPGPARTVTLGLVSPRMAVTVEADGRRLTVDSPPPPKKPRHWTSSGWGVDPANRASYKLPGRTRRRPLRQHRVTVALPTRGRITLALITNSVGGYDRFRRPRTQPQVAFVATRRKDQFVHHHELRLADPAARRRTPRDAVIAVQWTLPRHLRVGASVSVKCQRDPTDRRQQRCTGRIGPGERLLRWSVTERYRRPVGFFVGAGLAFTHRGVEALIRGGASVMLRRRNDLITLSAETDAYRRFALALVYQLFLPYSPHNWEMGPHFELGMALDLYPAVRPAIRAGVSLHISMLRVNLLFDLYPGELKKGGAPSWRGMAGAGIGF